jgi:hypothetical protein
MYGLGYAMPFLRAKTAFPIASLPLLAALTQLSTRDRGGAGSQAVSQRTSLAMVEAQCNILDPGHRGFIEPLAPGPRGRVGARMSRPHVARAEAPARPNRCAQIRSPFTICTSGQGSVARTLLGRHTLYCGVRGASGGASRRASRIKRSPVKSDQAHQSSRRNGKLPLPFCGFSNKV